MDKVDTDSCHGNWHMFLLMGEWNSMRTWNSFKPCLKGPRVVLHLMPPRMLILAGLKAASSDTLVHRLGPPIQLQKITSRSRMYYSRHNVHLPSTYIEVNSLQAIRLPYIRAF